MARLPIKRNISFHFGDTWRNHGIIWKPGGVAFDLTGFTARVDIVSKPGKTAVTTLTSGAGELTITALEGRVDFSVPTSKTETIPAGEYFYDLTVIGTFTQTLENGTLIVTDEGS